MSTQDTFPEVGIDNDEQILADLKAMSEGDLKSDGNAFAFVYSAGDKVNDLARKAFAAGMGGNGLDPTVYPSARKLENDICATVLAHLSAPEGAVGTVTSGGTESVMLSVKATRDYFRDKKPEITQPNILVPTTAHACFYKASHYLGVELIQVDVDSETMRVDMEDVKKKINDNTILLVGSAPSYAHGVIDPIEELAQLALERDINLHVDACIGGWVLPFERQNGVELAPFDFSVEGVSSISVDLHKYGFTPKGISVVMHRDPELRNAQYYTCATWTGYSVINSTIQGSKSLAPMAAAWAVLRKLGKKGYRELVDQMWQATQKLIEAVDNIDGLRVVGKPDMGLVAVTTEGQDIFVLSDRLTERGWHLQPTYHYKNSPTHIHFTIDPANSPKVDKLIADIKECMVDLPKEEEAPTALVQILEAIAQGAGGAGFDTSSMMAEFGIVDGKLPGAQAPIHRLIAACSPNARETLLRLFIGEMFK